MKESHLALRSRTTAASRPAHRRVWCALANPSFGLGEMPQDPDAGQSPRMKQAVAGRLEREPLAGSDFAARTSAATARRQGRQEELGSRTGLV